MHVQTCAITMNMMAGPPLFKRAIVQVGESRASLHPSLSQDLDSTTDTRYRHSHCMVMYVLPSKQSSLATLLKTCRVPEAGQMQLTLDVHQTAVFTNKIMHQTAAFTNKITQVLQTLTGHHCWFKYSTCALLNVMLVLQR